VALCVHVSTVRAGARGTHEERARLGIRPIPLCRARGLEALLMQSASTCSLIRRTEAALAGRRRASHAGEHLDQLPIRLVEHLDTVRELLDPVALRNQEAA
jgi:hypothetical protein